MFRDADPFQQATAAVGGGASMDVATERVERELAGQPEVRGELLHQLALIQRNQGRYDKADRLLRRAIDERRRLLGPTDTTDLELASLLYELGATLRMESSYASAESLVRKSLGIRQAVLPADHPAVAAALSELGTVRRYQGHYDEAARLIELAIRIEERQGESEELANTLNRLAEVRRSTGDLKGAELLTRRVIDIRERVLGPDHPLVAIAYTRLAGVLHDADVSGALQAARHAVDVGRRRLGPAHPMTLAAESELSLLLQKTGDLSGAERMQREVLAGRERLHGEYHRDVAGSMRNLSGMLRQRGDLAGAEVMTRRSMDIYRKTASDADVAPLVQDLAVLRYERGDAQGALPLAQQVVGFRGEEMWMWDAPSAADLVELSFLLAENGDCDGARTLSERAATIYEKVSPRDNASARTAAEPPECRVTK
jgi:tetratricopeptide (TPR) repeat protein